MVGGDGIGAVTPAFGVVEVSVEAELKVEGELVEVFRDLVIVVEVLVEVRLAVPVQVAQDGDLVAAEHVDVAVDNGDAQGLEHAAGHPLPCQLFERLADAVHDPHVAVPRADGRAAVVLEEVEATKAQPRTVGIVDGMRNRVDGVSAVAIAELAFRDEFLGPVCRATPRERGQVSGGLRRPHGLSEGVKLCSLGHPPDEKR